MQKQYLFVYGTLLAGECNHHVLGDSTCVQQHCWVYGRLYDTTYGYPVLELDDSSDDQVFGELYEISATQLLEVDKLEGYEQPGEPNLYDRVSVKVLLSATQQKVDAIVYCNVAFPTTEERWIKSGDWRMYRQGIKKIPVVLQETWERAVSQQDRAIFGQLNEQQLPVAGELRFLPVRTGFNHEGRCFATVLIQNATEQDVDFTRARLTYKVGEQEWFDQVFTIPQLIVGSYTATPWTFLFDDQLNVREQVEQEGLQLDQWGISFKD